MRKGDFWQYENLTSDEQQKLRKRDDLPCAICGTVPAMHMVANSGAAPLTKPENHDATLEAYCDTCMSAAEQKAQALEENPYTYRQVNAYFYRWNIAHQRAKAAAKKRGKQ